MRFEIRVDGPRTLTFSWDHPAGYEVSGVITAYQLSCVPQALGFPKTFDSQDFTERRVVTTESGFTPSTSYNCSVLALNRVGSGPSASASATTEDDGRKILSSKWVRCSNRYVTFTPCSDAVPVADHWCP